MNRLASLALVSLLAAPALAQTPRSAAEQLRPRSAETRGLAPEAPAVLPADLALARGIDDSIDTLKVVFAAVQTLEAELGRRATLGETASLEQRIVDLDSRLSGLSEIRRMEAQLEIQRERARYLTSVQTLLDLIENGEHLGLLSNALDISAGFAAEVNPLEDDRVQEVLRQGDDNDEDDWPTLLSGSSVLENPVVSVVVGVARIFSGGRRRDDRAEDLRHVACVMDVATRVDAESRVARSLLTEAGRGIASLEADARRELRRHLALVGYQAPVPAEATEEEAVAAKRRDLVEAYLAQREDDPLTDPLLPLIGAKLERDPGALYEVRTQTAATVRLAERYNDTRGAYLDYLNAQADLMERTADPAQNKCEGTVVGDKGETMPLVGFRVSDDLREIAADSRALVAEFAGVFEEVTVKRVQQLQDPYVARAD